jgi:hypothetical protein
MKKQHQGMNTSKAWRIRHAHFAKATQHHSKIGYIAYANRLYVQVAFGFSYTLIARSHLTISITDSHNTASLKI